LQTADVRARDAGRGKLIGQHGAAVRFGEPVSECFNPVAKGPHFKPRRNLPGFAVWLQPQIQAGGGDRHKRPDDVLARGGIVELHRVSHPVQHHA
jgi:hypothetical protein